MMVLGRFLNIEISRRGCCVTVFNRGILLVRTAKMRPPETWWTRLFSVSWRGWTLRLCELRPPKVRTFRYELRPLDVSLSTARLRYEKWAEIDRTVMAANKIKLRRWVDCVVNLSLKLDDLDRSPTDEVLFELGAGD